MSEDPEEEDDFKDTMSALFPDIVPLESHYYSPPSPKKPLLRPSVHNPSYSAPYRFQFSDINFCSPESEFRNSGVSFKILKELRRGRWPVTKTIDLHGLTLPQAREKLEMFFNQSLSEKDRCLLIIHGRGKNNESPLRNLVRRGLTLNTHSVLAFCPASRTQGGNGATLVLLKKP